MKGRLIYSIYIYIYFILTQMQRVQCSDYITFNKCMRYMLLKCKKVYIWRGWDSGPYNCFKLKFCFIWVLSRHSYFLQWQGLTQKFGRWYSKKIQKNNVSGSSLINQHQQAKCNPNPAWVHQVLLYISRLLYTSWKLQRKYNATSKDIMKDQKRIFCRKIDWDISTQK